MRSQKGETLMESLVAIMLLSIVAVSAFTGIQVALKASALHHEIAVSETLLRSAAEDLQNPTSPYIPLAGCPGHETYSGLPERARMSPMTVSVQFWTPGVKTPDPYPMERAAAGAETAPAASGVQFTNSGTCPTKDSGLQKIKLSVVTRSGHIQTLNILKRDGS
ncbi:MAG TPA: type II secretion system protein [Microthrixaceae bacterium]|nr:type II secretion system protein [Microthrixaceae bacterium]